MVKSHNLIYFILLYSLTILYIHITVLWSRCQLQKFDLIYFGEMHLVVNISCHTFVMLHFIMQLEHLSQRNTELGKLV